MSDHPLTLRDGRYAVIGVLGEGAQAQTLAAADKRDGRPVAIKRFVVRGARSWKDVELAEREARVLSGLNHPNLPGYVEHFEENGELYLVMEHVEGESLQQMKRRGGRLSRGEVKRLLDELAGLLEYLHGQAPPLIHRDIKPGNVIRRPDGGFTLVDFGSVRDRLKVEGGSTVVGTFGYMAPEQFQGRALPQTDVYAVGATALSVLTGEEPENLPHLGLKLDVARALPHEPELARLIESLVEPDPDRRPRNIRPLLRELEGARTTAPPTPRARVSVPPEARDAEVRSRPDWHTHPLAAEPLPRVVVLVCVIGLTLAQKAVRLAIGILVPLLLVMLSLIFGQALRLAARNVRSAAHRADDALWRAKRLVRRIQIAQDRPDPWAHTRQRRRVAQEGEQPRHRARVVDTTAEDLHDFEEHDVWESSESRGHERDWTRGSRSKR